MNLNERNEKNEKKFQAMEKWEPPEGTREDRGNQDDYDVMQAQDEWDEKTSVAEPDVAGTTVDINRSALSKHINDLFIERYSINPLQPAGELVKTWMTLHDEVQVIVKELEEKKCDLRVEVADEKLKEPEEKHWTA